jgi:Eukaryotic aspartyl protease
VCVSHVLVQSSLSQQKLIGVNKVGLKAQSMVTYNVKITVGSPEQLLTVIFDTGSFMCAVFSDVSPRGMKELGLLSVKEYFGRSAHTTAIALSLAFACAVFVVALVVHLKGKRGLRRDTRMVAVDVM